MSKPKAITYENRVTDGQTVYARVLWGKLELGRIFKEHRKFHYRPRGCAGEVRTEEFNTLAECKAYLCGPSMINLTLV